MIYGFSSRVPGVAKITTVTTACVGLLAATGIVVGGLSAGAAAAQGRRVSGDAAKPARIAAAVAGPTAPLIAVVSIGQQHVTVFSGDAQVARSGVSTGMSGHRTPTGVFSVIGKERYHESNLYSNAPMPFMQRITWSGVALHEGNLPGYPASHGCIRMGGDFAQRLYGMSRMGMRVIVADHDLSPVSFAHQTLPAPTFVRAGQLAGLAAPAPEAADGRMQLGAAPIDAERLLNPIERGRLEQGRAKSAAMDAQAEAAALLGIAGQRGQDARVAAEVLRAADAALSAVMAGRDRANDMLQNPALADDVRARISSQRDTLQAAVVDAERRAADARRSAQTADAEAFHAAAEAKAAVAERDLAEHAARVAERAMEPVSVFVSRKERRVFVRQGFEPVFEADVEIAEPQTPLGTHVFTATAAPDSDGAMRWVAITIPGQARADVAPVAGAGRAGGRGAERAQGVVVPATAAAALDRIKFSDEVLQKISEKLWIGASLIVSDHGISTETGRGTDFVVLTR